MRWVVILFSVFLFACAPKTAPLPLIPIPKAKPVLDGASMMQLQSNEAAKRNSKVQSDIAVVATITNRIGDNSKLAQGKIIDLIDQGQASRSELVELKVPIDGMVLDIAGLNLQLIDAKAHVSELEDTITTLQLQATETVADAAQADQAVDIQTQQSQTQAQNYIDTQTKYDAIKADFDSLAGRTKIYIVLASIGWLLIFGRLAISRLL